MPRKKKADENAIQKATIDLPKLSKVPQLVKGMKDLLPVDQPYWEHIRALIKKTMSNYSFERIDTPVLEDLSLYTHGVGKLTDIVEKEMYTFIDQGGSTLALRPEFTAGIARGFIEHGMGNWPQPVKLYTLGPLFRYEKPQEGRYRQHHQFNCEIVGEAKPSADAQLILIAYKFLKSLGINPVMHVNSIGCLQCRGAYKETLTEYYKSKRSHLCEDCKRRLGRNALRLLDCKEEGCQPIKAKAPHIVDALCEGCKGHFEGLLYFIDEFEIPYEHNPYLVRGLDYYTRTVFEFYASQEGEEQVKLLALGGGGRYDNLIEMFGGLPTPACGFGIGLERVVLKLKDIEQAGGGTPVEKKRKIDVFLAQLGEQAKRKAMMLYEDLLAEGFDLAESFVKDSLKAQLDTANKLGVKFTLILGQKELIDGTIIIRNMEGGEQEVVDIKKLIPLLHKKLGHEGPSGKEG
ncbi:MAG: histidine--tRNA ligase [bacterium]|nr:histidine--tRNA ligase [bacterium]